ncbi:MAG TPA: polysaccharide pyruvyl transferase family protein [Candidatus Omnitrophota bacterium]|nr:polysaccharide pyruvyl transferase family protein [Candidatus Omnitrophota bacterium]HRZ14109.1 polysaccharide pyruvyl transferase family protein [Candidatus Omnitrophota bacterium]
MPDPNTRFVLVGNGPYENRGCEAIVKGTYAILSHFYKDPQFLVYSNFISNAQYRKQVVRENNGKIKHAKYLVPRRFSFPWAAERILERVSESLYEDVIFRTISNDLALSQAVLAIGGDNFSLDYGRPDFFLRLNDFVLRKRKPIIIWGASIGPFTQDPVYERFIAEQLRRTIIFARESKTIDYCHSLGLKENVYKVTDPAFMMEPRMPDLSRMNIDLTGHFVGFNFSPLVAKYAAKGNFAIWVKYCIEIVQFVLSKIPCNVLLIPHVTSDHDNDLTCLRAIKGFFQKDPRVILIDEDLAADEVKYVISKCKLFVGTRTHSTIAAFSTCVPTLSLGYSLKSVGINSDVFNSLNYYINLAEFQLKNVNDKILELWNQQSSISEYLRERVDNFKKESLKSGKLLQELLSN